MKKENNTFWAIAITIIGTIILLLIGLAFGFVLSSKISDIKPTKMSEQECSELSSGVMSIILNINSGTPSEQNVRIANLKELNRIHSFNCREFKK